MAQTIEWLPAIWNYMKKMKSSISMVYDQFSQMNIYMHVHMYKYYKYIWVQQQSYILNYVAIIPKYVYMG